MGRLVDADAFKNFIENLPKEPNGTSRAYDEASILHFIDAQPTAYSIEKVVAELEKLKEHNKKLSEGAYLEDDKSFYFCAFTNFAKAIYIVRKGGVEC